MYWWEQARDILAGYEWISTKRRATKHQAGGVWLDNIFTIDTESTSAFLTPSGDLVPFDFEHGEKYWAKCKKFGWVYIWMVGVDDKVFYGRELADLVSFLSVLDDLTGKAQKIFYCHNLAWDFQFIKNVIKFERVFARKTRKVLTAEFENFHFRCSYFLVNMSLDKWAKQRKLPVTKAVGELQYNVIRTPRTTITEPELDYCSRDILVMFHGLKLYRDKYGHLYKIPLTQTGETREALADWMKSEKSWLFKMQKLIPDNLGDYQFLMSALFGGDVHANYHKSGKLLHGIKSVDFASSYPWVMLSERYPLTRFVKVRAYEKFMDNPRYLYIIHFVCENVESKLNNTWLSSSRCHDYAKGEGTRPDGTKYKRCLVDNGRLIRSDWIDCTMTSVDFECFRDFYNFKNLRVIDFRVSQAGYLNPHLLQFIVNAYRDKTRYKGVTEQYALYMFMKQIINGIYGDMVTREFTDEIVWNPDIDPNDPDAKEWDNIPVSPKEYIKKAANKRKVLPKLYKATQIGLFIPAYARKNLWRYLVAPLDHSDGISSGEVAYFDTDCIKYGGNDIRGAISAYNMHVIRTHYKIAERLGIDASELSPSDPEGKSHPIGVAELETDPNGYVDFKALGAKKYACREPGGPIEITVAGVPKGCAEDLSSVDELSDDYYFKPSPEKHKQKSILHYSDKQEKIIVDGWELDQASGICLQPTGYRVSITADYAKLLAMNQEKYRHELDFLIGGEFE